MTVWIVQTQKLRDYSAAEEFGESREVFSGTHRDYVPDAAIFHARKVLSRASREDWLVMAGDPALCGICIHVMASKFGEARILRWNKRALIYEPMILNFTGDVL